MAFVDEYLEWPEWFKTAKIEVPPYAWVGWEVVTLFADMC